MIGVPAQSGGRGQPSIVSIGELGSLADALARVEEARTASPRAIVARLGASSDGDIALLASRGLTHVVAELGGAIAAAHAYALPSAPSLDSLLACARAARAHGVHVIVETDLTRSSAPSLTDVARIAASLPALAFAIRMPRTIASPPPSLPLALEHALSALDVARRAGVFPLFVDGPRCLMGAFAPVTVRETPRAYAPACDGCVAKPSCSGIDAHAVATHLPGLPKEERVADRATTLLQLLAAR